MHSSRMRTARLLSVSPGMQCSRGVYLHGGCTCPLVAHISQHAMLPGGVPAWGVYLPRGMSLPGGVYLPGGCVPARGVYLPEGYLPRGGGVHLPRGGVCTCWGVYLPRRMHLPRYSPPVNRILDTRYWKYYLAPTSLRAVKINGLHAIVLNATLTSITLFKYSKRILNCSFKYRIGLLSF